MIVLEKALQTGGSLGERKLRGLQWLVSSILGMLADNKRNRCIVCENWTREFL
jgi:hypothetical protein